MKILLVLCFLFLGQIVHAQDDFPPFLPGVEPWNINPVPFPQAPYDYTNGLAPSRDRPGGRVLTIPARRGDTIRLQYVLEWWGLGPLSTSVMSNAGVNVRWAGPNTRQGQWRGWCLSCEIDMEAGDDNPQVWVDYIGSSAFGVHLELLQVIPAPHQPLFSQDTKNRLSNLSTDLGYAAAIYGGMAAWVAPEQPALAAYIGLFGGAFLIGSLAANQLATHDPYDAYACANPYWHWNDPEALGLRWYDGQPDFSGVWAFPQLWNNFVVDAITIEGLERMAIDCYPDEYDRAWWASRTAGYYYQDLASNISVLSWWLRYLGLNNVDPNTGWDVAGTGDWIASEIWGVGSEMEQ